MESSANSLSLQKTKTPGQTSRSNTKKKTLHSFDHTDEDNELKIDISYTSYDNIETNRNPLTGP